MDIKILEAINAPISRLNSPSAWLGHQPFASWLIKILKPKIFVELGVHYGHSYFSFCEGVIQGAQFTQCFGIDTWGGDAHTGRYDESIFVSVNNHNETRFSSFSKLMRMSFDEAALSFQEKSIELLHIDGFHTYEAVKHDFDTWLPKLSPHAVILFHDTQVFEGDFGVWKFWKELQNSYPCNFEFFHSHGLGVIQLSQNLKCKELDFLSSEYKYQNEFRQYFSRIAELSLKEQELESLRSDLLNKDAYVNLQHQEIASLKKIIHDKDAYVNLQHHKIAMLQNEVGIFYRLYKSFSKKILSALFRAFTKVKSLWPQKTGLARRHVFENKSKANAGSLSAPMTRFEMITGQLRLDGVGVEIGPSYNPILPKRSGYAVTVVDHATSDDLKDKYAAWGVDTSLIEDVDIIWSGGSLYDVFELGKSYDYIVASNVIEHIPNPILFLQDCEKLLKEDGKISLVIPDRDFCFDYYQQLTTTGEWVEAYLQDHIYHPPRKHFNHFAYAAKRGDAIAWGEWTKEELSLQSHTLAKAFEAAKMQTISKDYIDTHGWYFSPASFELIIKELGELGLINLRLIQSYPTYGFEFFITLGRSSKNSRIDDRGTGRFELINKVFGRTQR